MSQELIAKTPKDRQELRKTADKVQQKKERKHAVQVASDMWDFLDSTTTTTGVASDLTKSPITPPEINPFIGFLGAILSWFTVDNKKKELKKSRKAYKEGLKQGKKVYKDNPNQIENDLSSKSWLGFKMLDYILSIYKASLAVLLNLVGWVKLIALTISKFAVALTAATAKVVWSVAAAVGAVILPVYLGVITIIGGVGIKFTLQALKKVRKAEKQLLSDLEENNSISIVRNGLLVEQDQPPFPYHPETLRRYLRNEFAAPGTIQVCKEFTIAAPLSPEEKGLTAGELKDFLDLRDAYLRLSKYLTDQGIKMKWVEWLETLSEDLFNSFMKELNIKDLCLKDLQDFSAFSKTYHDKKEAICSRLVVYNYVKIEKDSKGRMLDKEEKTVEISGEERLNTLINFTYNREKELTNQLAGKFLRTIGVGLGCLLTSGIVIFLLTVFGLPTAAAVVVGVIITGITNLGFYLLEKLVNKSLPWNKPKIEREQKLCLTDNIIDYFLAQQEQQEIENNKIVSVNPLNPLKLSETLPQKKVTPFGVKIQHERHQLEIRENLKNAFNDAISIVSIPKFLSKECKKKNGIKDSLNGAQNAEIIVKDNDLIGENDPQFQENAGGAPKEEVPTTAAKEGMPSDTKGYHITSFFITKLSRVTQSSVDSNTTEAASKKDKKGARIGGEAKTERREVLHTYIC